MKKPILIVLISLIWISISIAQDIYHEKVIEGLQAPTAIHNAGDGTNRLFILEKPGRIQAWDGENLTLFMDITDRVKDTTETGLMSVAFHPDFTNNQYFYVTYGMQSGAKFFSRISRFTASTDMQSGEPGSEKILIEFEQPGLNHNANALAFGNDGYLYISTGDGGTTRDSLGLAQNLGKHHGKVLRIDVNGGDPYAIPAGNPFTSNGNALGEVYAYGFRNPWRMTIDEETGDIWVADVGTIYKEMIKLVKPGANYGWNVSEGTACITPPENCDKNGFTMPVYQYDRTNEDCSITGGYVYRGSAISSLMGHYVFSDFCSGKIWKLSFNNGASKSLVLEANQAGIATFGEDESGELYFANYTTGIVYKIQSVITNVNAPKQLSYSVYPNPASEQFIVRMKNQEVASSIQIFNSLGTMVKQIESPKRGTNVIQTYDLSPGIYNVSVILESGQRQVEKIVINE